jgi:hypothetical protein
VCGCVYKIENFRTLSAPSEIASLREAISSSAAFKSTSLPTAMLYKATLLCIHFGSSMQLASTIGGYSCHQISIPNVFRL